MTARNLAAFAFGPLAVASLGLIAVPVTAWVFRPEDLGRFNLFQVTLSFCILFFTLGLDQAYVREYHSSDDKLRLLKSCAAPGLVFLAAATLVGSFFSTEISRLLYDIDQPSLYAMTVAAVVVTYFSRFLSLVLRMEERGMAFSISQALPKMLQLFLVCGLAVSSFEKTFSHLLTVALISIFAVLAIFASYTQSNWKPATLKRIHANQLKGLLSFGLPLVLTGLSFWAINAAITYALRWRSGLSELAIYSVASSFAGVAVVLQSIFSTIWTPLAFKWEANGVDMARVDTIANQVLAAVCLVIVLCGSFSWLTDFLLPAQYQEVKYLIVCCMFQPLLYTLSVVTSVGIGITRKSMLSFAATSLAMLTSIAAAIALVPSLGARGAAVANALAFFALFAANTEFAARAWRQFRRRRIYYFVSASLVCAIATTLFGQQLPFHYSFAWAALTPLIYVSFRNEWTEILQGFRSTYGRSKSQQARPQL